MPWARSLDLYLNVAAPVGAQLVRNAGNLAALERPSWIAGDKFAVRLHLRQPGANGVGSTAVELEAGDVINLAGARDATTEDLLFHATGFVDVSVGEESDPIYEAVLNLNTEELTEALGEEPSMIALVDIEIRNATNTERRTLRFQVTILQQVFESDAPTPTELPEFPAPEDIVTKTTKGLHTRVAMPAATAEAGTEGEFAVNGDELAIYVAGTGWIFFTGFQK